MTRQRKIAVLVGSLRKESFTDDPLANWAALREVIKSADGVLFATPESKR